MTKLDPASFNVGILAMVDIARRSADALASDPRGIPVSFAISALDQLAIDGQQLLIRPDKSAVITPAPTEKDGHNLPTLTAAE